MLAEASEDADAAQGTFDGIQPPDHRADRLRDQLDELLGQATDTPTELRTLARRGRRIGGRLGAFVEAAANRLRDGEPAPPGCRSRSSSGSGAPSS